MDPAICIPRMPRNTTISYIHQVIHSMDIGEIDDIQSQYNNVPANCKRVFIHLKTWYHTANGLKVKRLLMDKKTIKVVHENFQFWKLAAMRT